jgi:hypothetical protein
MIGLPFILAIINASEVKISSLKELAKYAAKLKKTAISNFRSIDYDVIRLSRQ